jgi:hypothetical protein
MSRLHLPSNRPKISPTIHAARTTYRTQGTKTMAKPHRLLKKANHGARPANAKARRAKRRKIKT